MDLPRSCTEVHSVTEEFYFSFKVSAFSCISITKEQIVGDLKGVFVSATDSSIHQFIHLVRASFPWGDRSRRTGSTIHSIRVDKNLPDDPVAALVLKTSVATERHPIL